MTAVQTGNQEEPSVPHEGLTTGDGIAIFAFVFFIIVYVSGLIAMVIVALQVEPASTEDVSLGFWDWITIAFVLMIIYAPIGGAYSRVDKILKRKHS